MRKNVERCKQYQVIAEEGIFSAIKVRREEFSVLLPKRRIERVGAASLIVAGDS